MRIISGTARGRRLATFPGRQIRPTSDRVREAIFSMLLSRLETFAGKNVLDLYAGTGAMAIEALSRGAARAVLIDQGPQAASLIPGNLQSCGFDQRAHFLRTPVEQTLPRLSPETFDLIFADPPYDLEGTEAIPDRVFDGGMLLEDGWLVMEHPGEKSYKEHPRFFELRKYGRVHFSFFK